MNVAFVLVGRPSDSQLGDGRGLTHDASIGGHGSQCNGGFARTRRSTHVARVRFEGGDERRCEGRRLNVVDLIVDLVVDLVVDSVVVVLGVIVVPYTAVLYIGFVFHRFDVFLFVEILDVFFRTIR